MASAVRSHDRAPEPLPGYGSYVPALFYGVGLAGLSYAAMGFPPWMKAVITLGAAIVFIALWRLRFRGRLSYADPGIFFVIVVCLYTALPLLTFEYYDYSFGRGTDARLYHIAVDEGLIADVWLCASLAMAGFGSAYLAFRIPRMPRLGPIPRGALGALWIGLAISVAVLVVAYLGRGGTGESYTDEYLFFRTLPLYVVQILNILTIMFQVSAFGLIAYYMSERRTGFAVALLAFMLLFFFVTTEARSMLVILTGGFFILRDHLVKRFSPVTLGAAVSVGLLTFLLLGFIREGDLALSDAAGRSEFVAVFVTALDIQQLYITGSTLDMNVNLLISDIFRLIPQQLLTFEKVDPAAWYVSNFYPRYAEAGAAMAFGMVAEAVLSGGGLSALARGVALGIVVCLVFNFLTRRGSIWRLIIYVWVFISLYQCFRDTTFTLAGRFAFQFGPALLLVFVLSQLLAIRYFGPPDPLPAEGRAPPPA